MLKTEEFINKRIDELIQVMKLEKDLVDSNFGNWFLVEQYLFKSKSTMKALRKYVNYLKNKNIKKNVNIVTVCSNCYNTRLAWETVCPSCYFVII